MRKIIAAFVDNRFTVNLITVFLIVIGLLSVKMMSRDLMPQMTFDRIDIQANLPGASPSEIEEYVTYPIEDAVAGMSGVDKVESTSETGSMRIKLNFRPGYPDMNGAIEKVRNAVAGINYKLPTDLRNIRVNRLTQDGAFVAWAGIKNFDANNSKHRIALENLKDELSKIKGTTNIRSFERARDVYVRFDLKKLKSYELGVPEVKRYLRQHLNIAPLGLYKNQGEDYTVQIKRSINSLADIKNLVVRSNMNGLGIKLSDIADVGFDLENDLEWYFVDGKPAAGMIIRKTIGPDIIDMDKKVKQTLTKFNKNNTQGLEAKVIVDGANFIRTQLNLLVSNGLLGLAIVVLILMLFLNLRVALMTALGLPLAYGGTFILLNFLGMSFDLFSIVGMILVLGVLVDDAIIVSEKYCALLAQGLKRRDAAIEAVAQLIKPVSGTIVTTIVAFLPLIFIKSEMSSIMLAVPIVVITSLMLSWFESFFILPNHLYDWVNSGVSVKKENFMNKLRNVYESVLKVSLKLRYLVLIGVLVLTGYAGYLAQTKVKKDFMLNIEPERLAINVHLKKSTSLEETMQSIQPVVDWISNQKDQFHSTGVSVGSIWDKGRELKGYKYAKVVGYIPPSEKYPLKAKSRIKKEIQPLLKELKEAKNSNFQLLQSSFSWQSRDQDKGQEVITVNIQGKDDADDVVLEKELKSAFKDIPALGEYLIDPNRQQKTWRFELDNSKLAKYDLTPVAISQQIRGVFSPDEIAQVRIEGKNTFVFAEFIEQKNLNISKLSPLQVITGRGVAVPLSLLGKWEEVRSFQKIQHENRKRQFQYDFGYIKDNKEKLNKDAVVAKMQIEIDKLQKKWPRVAFSIKSLSDEEKSTQEWAILVATICIISVFFVLALFLQSWTQPIVVSLPIPFALVGVILSLYLHNLPLGVMALVGVIGTIGISVNDSIVMMDEINRLAKKKRLERATIIKGAGNRFRAILLTTLTTLGGIFPMAYSVGGEIGFTQPLAFSMGWGLAFATFLTLFFLPALLVIRNDFLNFGGWISNKTLGRKNTLVKSTIEGTSEFTRTKPKGTPPQNSVDKEPSPSL